MYLVKWYAVDDILDATLNVVVWLVGKCLPQRWLDFLRLESHDWGPPTYDSHLVQTIHQLRYKPIGQFTDADLRICIGQDEGLLFLVPLALARVESAPLLDASFYPGDLLIALLQADPEFWNRQKHLARQLSLVADRGALETDESLV